MENNLELDLRWARAEIKRLKMQLEESRKLRIPKTVYIRDARRERELSAENARLRYQLADAKEKYRAAKETLGFALKEAIDGDLTFHEWNDIARKAFNELNGDSEWTPTLTA